MYLPGSVGQFSALFGLLEGFHFGYIAATQTGSAGPVHLLPEGFVEFAIERLSPESERTYMSFVRAIQQRAGGECEAFCLFFELLAQFEQQTTPVA